MHVIYYPGWIQTDIFTNRYLLYFDLAVTCLHMLKMSFIQPTATHGRV